MASVGIAGEQGWVHTAIWFWFMMSQLSSSRGATIITRAIAIFVVTVCCWTAPLFPQATHSESETEIRSLMAQARKASLEGDSDKIASLMADEYLQTDISGHVQDKATWLKEYFNPIAGLIRAGKLRWEVYDRKDVQIRIYGDSAVVIGALEAKGSGARFVPQTHTWVADPNASFSWTLRFTHVYIKRNGKWLLAALQNAVPLPPPPPAK